MNATTTKSIEQLRTELADAQLALEEQERVAREKERAKKLAAERAVREEKDKAIREKMEVALTLVYTSLKAAGIECTRQGLTIQTGNRNTQVGIEAESKSTSSFLCSSYSTGRFVITVGDKYQEFPCVRYPQLKAGGHNVEKIANTIKDRLSTIIAARNRANEEHMKKMQGINLADELKAELGINCIVGAYTYYLPTGSHRQEAREVIAPPNHVIMQLGNRTMNEAQVRVMAAALAECAKLATKAA